MIYNQVTLPLLAWFDTHGRKNLPWQLPRTPYRVWVSEIMLQQTQVKTVIPYFTRFITDFPDIKTLAQAEEDKVLALWSGLGYYSRVRNLHKTARIICQSYQGQFPSNLEELVKLPGIGESTAAAICSQAFNQPTAILDANVKRVLSRYFLIEGWPEQKTVKKKLFGLANECMSKERCADYTQAIMDLGATCCTARNPNCSHCPLQKHCQAKLANKVLSYPHKKEKKLKPTKKEQFLVLHNQAQQIYLEKRPPAGIWGGLWCLPSIDIDCCPQDYLKTGFKINSLPIEKLLTIKHSFSHFHLHIQALAIKAESSAIGIAECSGKWFKYEELKNLGMAKPVSVIVDYFWKKSFLGE